MHQAKPLEVGPFGPNDVLSHLDGVAQAVYLRRYLEDLGAATVIHEPHYFDRDYLAEFAAFYSVSAAGYSNVCARIHFFSESFDRTALEAAIAGDTSAATTLTGSYLGFTVIRPIPSAPLGRTVVRWYPDHQQATTPRMVPASREYACHLVGLTLTVRGLAWQQQDSGVSACATIALWSMLHSSALDGWHGVPTTASVARSAHRTASLGARVFPSAGLQLEQLCEAIKEHGLSPVVVPADLPQRGSRSSRGFSRERFAATCAVMLRSGFPVLVLGDLAGANHAVCAVGFRSSAPPVALAGQVAHHDMGIAHLYLHDDNLGPGVRFAIGEDERGAVELKADAPSRISVSETPDATAGYPRFRPECLIMAVPDELRTTPDALHIAGLLVAGKLSRLLESVAEHHGQSLPGLAMSTSFSLLRDYLGPELQRMLVSSSALGKVRLGLGEHVPPMSLYIGVVRIGEGEAPLLDILFDTTDSDSNLPVLAYVVFAAALRPIVEGLLAAGELPAAPFVEAFS